MSKTRRYKPGLSDLVHSIVEFRHFPQGRGKVFMGFKLASDVIWFMSSKLALVASSGGQAEVGRVIRMLFCEPRRPHGMGMWKTVVALRRQECG